MIESTRAIGHTIITPEGDCSTCCTALSKLMSALCQNSIEYILWHDHIYIGWLNCFEWTGLNIHPTANIYRSRDNALSHSDSFGTHTLSHVRQTNVSNNHSARRCNSACAYNIRQLSLGQTNSLKSAHSAPQLLLCRQAAAAAAVSVHKQRANTRLH